VTVLVLASAPSVRRSLLTIPSALNACFTWPKLLNTPDTKVRLGLVSIGNVSEFANAEVCKGGPPDLPMEAWEFDACVLPLLVHHQREPAAVLVTVRKSLALGGVPTVIDMGSYTRSGYRTGFDDKRRSFGPRQTRSLAVEAKLMRSNYLTLRPAIAAKDLDCSWRSTRADGTSPCVVRRGVWGQPPSSGLPGAEHKAVSGARERSR
jgi:hypothetical protein